MERAASPPGDRLENTGSSSSTGDSQPPPPPPPPPPPATTSTSNRDDGGSGDSWGASVLAMVAKHPSEALTVMGTAITLAGTVASGAFLFLWRKIEAMEEKITRELKKNRKRTRKQIRKLLQDKLLQGPQRDARMPGDSSTRAAGSRDPAAAS